MYDKALLGWVRGGRNPLDSMLRRDGAEYEQDARFVQSSTSRMVASRRSSCLPIVQTSEVLQRRCGCAPEGLGMPT